MRLKPRPPIKLVGGIRSEVDKSLEKAANTSGFEGTVDVIAPGQYGRVAIQWDEARGYASYAPDEIELIDACGQCEYNRRVPGDYLCEKCRWGI